ncbi:MAG: OmpA family protein [Candidatus Hydrogenedentota bacterium]|nr:MAG: OmpA family protein [Candidatus Hydrogenedentota bacterium]
MKEANKSRTGTTAGEGLLVTAQRKLLKPRIQNKLILAFVSTAVISIAISTYLVVRITSGLMENEIEGKIRDANSSVLSVIDRYEENAFQTLNAVLEKPGLAEALKKEKVPYLFTPPISAGSETPVGLWVPGGQPVAGTGPPLSPAKVPPTATKTIMQIETNGIQTLLAGAVMPIIEGKRQYGTLAIGYALGKSFAQDLEIMTGANIRIVYEKMPAGPSSIFFKGSSFELSEAAFEEVREIASIMREHPKLALIVEGHTDSTGSEKQNYRLGLRRAEAVKDALVKEGISQSRIQTISFGEARAIAHETTEDGRAMNRRVELEFKSREDPLVGAIEDLPMTSMVKQSIFVHKQRYYDRDALLKGEPYRAIYQPLVGYGGKVLGLIFVGIPRKYTFEATVTTWHFFPFILAVGFLLATVLGYTISRSISRPIRHLYRGVLMVADGDLGQQFEAKTKDEIGDLERAFNIMTKKLRQLRELEQEMQRRNRLAALGELSAGVAHEIRNPLGIVKNSAEMLRDRVEDDARRRELTDYIVEEVDRLNKVVTNFLQFARPSEPSVEPVDINAVLEHTITFLEPEAHSANISIEKMLSSGLPSVLADPEQCHQMFLNLCMNAFQAMDGSGTLKVETKLSDQASSRKGDASATNNFSPALAPNSETPMRMVDVIITDTGEGIPAEVIPRIFDPFFSTKEEGVGLGLSLVHKIVENHNGRIRVTSSQGSGTTFTISLPTVDQSKG